MSSNCNCEWRLSEHNSNWQILAHNSCYLFALTDNIYIWAPPIEMCKSIRKTLTMKEVKQVDWVQSQTSFINDSRIQVTICKKKLKKILYSQEIWSIFIKATELVQMLLNQTIRLSWFNAFISTETTYDTKRIEYINWMATSI